MLRNEGWRRFRPVNVNELEWVLAAEGRAASQELVANHSSRVRIDRNENQSNDSLCQIVPAPDIATMRTYELMLRSVSAKFFTSTETAVRSRNCSASVEGWMTSVCGFSEQWISEAAMARVMRRANSMDVRLKGAGATGEPAGGGGWRERCNSRTSVLVLLNARLYMANHAAPDHATRSRSDDEAASNGTVLGVLGRIHYV